MRKVGFLALYVVLILIAGMALSSGVYKRAALPEKNYEKELEVFLDALSIVKSDYVDPQSIGPKKLIHGAISGMISSLDPYSEFLEPDEFKDIKIETKGEFGGIGVEIAVKDGFLTVIAPIDGTPAFKAGILAGDKIMKIGAKSTKKTSLQDAVKSLRGRPGTPVEISVLRKDDKGFLDFTITRAIIKVESIKDIKIIDEDYKIGYVKLVEFQERTPVDLEAALKKLKSEGMKALILDLRNNPGGLLEVAVGVAEKFIPKGKVIVSTKGNEPSQNTVFKSEGSDEYLNFPMIVLVNKGAASASEIVAGAIQAHKRGLIIGVNTFGKGSVQTVIPMSDGSAIRLTTARYYTPDNKSINQDGITPDIQIEREELKDSYDTQLYRSIDLLKAMKVLKFYEETKT